MRGFGVGIRTRCKGRPLLSPLLLLLVVVVLELSLLYGDFPSCRVVL